MPNPELSICVTIKDRSRATCSRRPLTLFPNCVASLRRAVEESGIDAELVVTDWKSTDWPLAEWLPQVLGDIPLNLVTPEREQFSRGHGRNLAAKHAASENLLFLDADMLLDAEVLRAGMGSLSRGAACFPVVVHQMQQDSTETSVQPLGTGNCFVTKAVWEAAGKFLGYVRWGYEDWGFLAGVAAVTRVERPLLKGFVHQWHPDTWRDKYSTDVDEVQKLLPH